MTKFLGIDYGTKRIGLAIADLEVGIATPCGVVSADDAGIKTIADLCKEKEVSLIVVGESKNFAMKDNAVMVDTREFVKKLEDTTSIKVVFELEYLSSVQAKNTQETLGGNINKSDGAIDSSSAAVILQSYIDTLKNSQS